MKMSRVEKAPATFIHEIEGMQRIAAFPFCFALIRTQTMIFLMQFIVSRGMFFVAGGAAKKPQARECDVGESRPQDDGPRLDPASRAARRNDGHTSNDDSVFRFCRFPAKLRSIRIVRYVCVDGHILDCVEMQ